MLNRKGVIELPLRLIVTIVVGGIALTTVLAFLMSPCIFKKDLQICLDKRVINAGEETTITITVLNDDDKPIKGANVLLKGLGNAFANITNDTGIAKLHVKVNLPAERNEGYLELIVNANRCYRKYKEENAVKVIKEVGG